MSSPANDRIVRRLDQAEGFLMLDLPERALEILQGHGEWATMQFEASFLTGEALRRLGRHREALLALERASALKPTHLGAAIALGWCYKRTHRLAQAIDALDRAVQAHPEEPLLHYNLSCYWSLAGQTPEAVKALARALDLDPTLHAQIRGEADFDALRGDPEFERLVHDRAPVL